MDYFIKICKATGEEGWVSWYSFGSTPISEIEVVFTCVKKYAEKVPAEDVAKIVNHLMVTEHVASIHIE